MSRESEVDRNGLVIIDTWQSGQLSVRPSEDGEKGGHEVFAAYHAASSASSFGRICQHLSGDWSLVGKRHR